VNADRVAVAYSGGRDSTALLHATLAAAQANGTRVIALHVHHGLSPHADAWLVHCEAQCARWARTGRPIDFMAQRLDDRPAAGDSIEAWARRARYRALRVMADAAEVSIVLLAHHRRDQAETLLLQALRGAGLAGLAGMPRSVLREGITWLRPWLTRSRDDIDAYVLRHRLKHIEDDSNDDSRFARNRLRLEVWPALSGAFPQAESALAMSAGWAQEASELLDEIALDDLIEVGEADALNIEAWSKLSHPRRSNALRSWLAARLARPAPATLVTRLLVELATLRSARWPLRGTELRLHRGRLFYQTVAACETAQARDPTLLSIRRAGRIRLSAWAGTLKVARVRACGVPLAWLAHCELREREGGERFQSGMGRPPRSLKKQYQAAGIATWDRSGPLVYSGGQLVFAPGLGIDARVIGSPEQALVTLQWLPHATTA
jgi:tRNA(Ile)-lysidine synthase